MFTRGHIASAVALVGVALLYYEPLPVRFQSPAPLYTPKDVDLLTATTQDLRALLDNKAVTSVQLVSEYRRRITRDNRAGLWLNAILSTAPDDVLLIAKERDEERQKRKFRGPLHGIPFVVKDTIVTDPKLRMRTTYGSYALQYSVAPQTAFIIKKAEEAEAIVLGKTNPQELGGYKGFQNPGWSKVGGRTVSLYDFGEPCGSSSGSGVAVSAGSSPIALGTDTTGSVTCPAAFNAAYGLRPTLGLLSRTGILPTTSSFDTAGIITKSVADIAMWMDVLAQPAEADPVTMKSPNNGKNYGESINGKWKKWRIGVLDRPVFWNESIPLLTTAKEDYQMIKALNETLKSFRNLGAAIIEDVRLPMAHMPDQHPTLLRKIRVRITTLNHAAYELKTNLNGYLATLGNTSIHSLDDLIPFNAAHPQLAYDGDHPGQEWLEQARDSAVSPHDYLELEEQRAALVKFHSVEFVLEKHNLDAIVVPAFTKLTGFNAMSGTPFGVVPVGQYSSGRPLGLGFTVRRYHDALLLQIMAAAEASLPARPLPKVLRYRSTADKARYWWSRLNVPKRSPENRVQL